MDGNLIQNLLEHAWPPLVLLAVIWSVLLIAFFFVRRQLKREQEFMGSNKRKGPLFRKAATNNGISNTVSSFDKQDFLKEIDQLAIYVSRLPRPDSVIREYRRDEFENENK